jgi:hypothetical protein
MNLNDPFGRVARREQQEYESLRASLKESGVNSRGDVDVVLERIQMRGTKIVAVIAIITLLLTLLYPGALTITLIFSGLSLLWVFKMTKNARQHIQRYIDEEIAGSDQQDPD